MSADLTRLIHIASSRFFQVIGRSPEELWLGPMMQKTLCEEVYYYFPSTPPPIAAREGDTPKGARRVLAVATDMPFVSAEVVRAMMAWGGSADAIIARL